MYFSDVVFWFTRTLAPGSPNVVVHLLIETWRSQARRSITVASFWTTSRPTWEPSRPWSTMPVIRILWKALPRNVLRGWLRNEQRLRQICRFWHGQMAARSFRQLCLPGSLKHPPSFRRFRIGRNALTWSIQHPWIQATHLSPMLRPGQVDIVISKLIPDGCLLTFFAALSFQQLPPVISLLRGRSLNEGQVLAKFSKSRDLRRESYIFCVNVLYRLNPN